MSYILQALKRAEEDRRAAAASSRQAPAARPRDPAVPDRRRAAPTRRVFRVWVVAAGAAVAVNAVGFGAAFVLSRPSSVAVVAPSPAADPQADAPAAPVAPAPPPPAPPVETRPSPDPPPAAVALARPQTGEASAPKAPSPEVERQPSATAPAVVPRPDPTPAAVRRAVRRGQAPETDPDTRPEPWQGKAAWLRDRFRSGGEMQRSGESYEMEQPQLAREEPPGDPTKLRIEVLVWAADPGKRMVYLNGRKYVEGDAIEKGTVIEQIVQDGIVLLHQGQRVRVPSGAR